MRCPKVPPFISLSAEWLRRRYPKQNSETSPSNSTKDPARGGETLLSLWSSPLLFLAIFLSASLAVLWVIQTSAEATKKKQLVENAESTAAGIRLRLKGNEDYLLMLAKDWSNGDMTAQSFQERAARYVADHPELINITWVDAGFVVCDVAPLADNKQILGLRLNLPEPKRASHLAREERRPVYTRPFETIQGTLSFEVWVPVFHGDDFLGLFGGIYSCEKILKELITPWQLEHNQVGLSDASGRILRELPSTGTTDEKLAHRLSLTQPENGILLQFRGYGAGVLDRNLILLEIICLAFAIGIVCAMWKLCREVKAGKQVEEALRLSEERFRHMAAAIGEVFWLMSPEGNKVLYVSPAFEKIWGRSCTEMRDTPGLWIKMIHPDDTQLVQHALEALAKGRHFDIKYRIIRPDKVECWINDRGYALRDNKGEIILVSGVASDITENKRAEDALVTADKYNRNLIEVSLDPLVTIGPDGKITDVNTATEMATGCSRSELIGTDFSDYFTDSEQAKAGYQEVFREGSVRDYPLKLRHADGSVMSVLYNASVYRNENGAVVGVFAAARDITRIEQTTEALSASEARFRSLVTALSEIVWTTNPDGLVTDDIPTWRIYTGQTCEEVQGTGWSRALHPDDLARTLSVWQQAVKNRSSYQVEYRIRRHDGEYRHFAVRGVPVLNADDTLREWVGLCTDIHDHKLAEEKIRHLASIVESSDDAIIGKSLDEQILSWNKGAEQIYGFTAEEIIGRPVSIIVPLPLREELPAIMERVKSGERIVHYETTRIRKDGQPIQVALTISPIKDAHGQIVAASTIARDITERKHAEDEIRKLSRYTRSLIEASLDPLVTISPSGIITDVNASTEKATGCTRAELIGTDFSDYFTDPGNARAGYEQVFREGSVRDYPLDLRHRRGGVTPVLYNATVYRNESNEVVGVFAAARDVTERKRAEEEIKKLNQELEQRVIARTAQLESANKELEAFAYSVSHDLRAPLRSIDGFSKILLDDYADKFDEDGRENLQIVRAASQRMAQLIDDILQLSRLNRAPLRQLPVDLSMLAGMVADDLKKLESRRSVEFVIEPGCTVLADGNLMRVVLENLIGNAWKFTGKRPDAKIEFGREIRDGKPVFFVRDNGVGFDMKYAPKLFGAFQRLHTTSEFPGTGIGLASVQRIIHRHSGEIWIESSLNGGATAYFTIPQPEKNHENKNDPPR